MVGAALARACVARGDEVIVLSRTPTVPPRLKELGGSIDVRCVNWDDPASVRSVLDSCTPDVVFHLATAPFNPPGIPLATYLAANVGTTAALIDALAPGTAIVFTSSAAVYGPNAGAPEDDPLTPATWLGTTKAMAGTLIAGAARLKELFAVELRLFTPYGPWERSGRLIPSTILAALAGRPVELGAGTPERDFVYIDDVVDALLRAAALRPASPVAINIGSGNGVTVREVVGRILALAGRPNLAQFGVHPIRADEIMRMSANIDRAKAVLGWLPRTSLDEGLRTTIDWFRAHQAFAAQLVA